MKTDGLPLPLDRPTQTFSGRSFEVLREMVLAGRIKPGERLNEVELAAALGISRGPLREAIQRLRSEGLLTAVSGRGTYVRTFTRDELREIYEVRIALETHAVRLATESCRREDINELTALLDETENVLRGAADRPYPRDLDFHERIVALAGNQALLDAATEVHRQVELARSRSAQEPDRARAAFAEHREIVGHIAAGRAEKAASTLTRHLRSSLGNALYIFETGGEQLP